jgi:site-specific recombinase XerD
MASMLLEKNIPLSTISNFLGHVDTNSTAVYLKVGIQKLKECALTFEEGAHHG